jgi:hypothetical protein
MPEPPHEHADAQLQLLRQIAGANAPIAGDVAKISDDTWAIHGVIPVDGDVILAEFDSYDEARTVLKQFSTGSGGTADP